MGRNRNLKSAIGRVLRRRSRRGVGLSDSFERSSVQRISQRGVARRAGNSGERLRHVRELIPLRWRRRRARIQLRNAGFAGSNVMDPGASARDEEP